MIGKIFLVIFIVIALAVSSYLIYSIYQDVYSQPKSLNVTYNMLANESSYSQELQFEKNMRFDHINLSYSIESNCDAKRIKGMIAAFKIGRAHV
jgi:hypothetical protein